MEWRVWMRTQLAGHAPLTAIIPADHQYPAGSLDAAPDKPFIEIKVGPRQPGPFAGVGENYADVWVHDEAGTYMTIDAAIEEIKAALSGAERSQAVSASGGVVAQWTGDSDELADDGYGTICRYTSFKLNGREQ